MCVRKRLRAYPSMCVSSDHWLLSSLQGGNIDLIGCTDIVDFPTLHSAMKVLTFSDSECNDIFQLLASLLHLGNLSYQAKLDKNMDSCDVAMDSEFLFATKLLQVENSMEFDLDLEYISHLKVNADDLKKAITTKNLVTRDDLVVTNMSVGQAINIRDALVKGIYGRLFVWIVDKINKAIYRPCLSQAPKSGGKTKIPSRRYSSIGVLDIFGFENFGTNSYEQLCINFANENLQQFFVRHIFKMEQDEYAAELIDWQHIAFTDNQDTLDLIGVKSCNILALIDEESRFPRGTDNSLLMKLTNAYSKHPRFIKQKADIAQVTWIRFPLTTD